MLQKKNEAAKKVGRKSLKNVSSDSNDEAQEDADRSEADWLRLSKEMLVLKCDQNNLCTNGPEVDAAECLVSFYVERDMPGSSENEEEQEHEGESTELAEVAS